MNKLKKFASENKESMIRVGFYSAGILGGLGIGLIAVNKANMNQVRAENITGALIMAIREGNQEVLDGIKNESLISFFPS